MAHVRARRALLLALPLLAVSAAAGAQTAPRPPAGDGWTLPATPPPAPISAAEHARRRAALAAGMEDGALVVFGAGETELDYLPFSQTPAMRYLTGITEPGAVLVVHKRGGQVREQLFVLPRDPSREVWEGARLGAEGAQALARIPTRTVDRMMAAVDSLLDGPARLYVAGRAPGAGGIQSPEQQMAAAIAARNPGTQVVSLAGALRQMRAVKSPAELALIRRAVLITLLAHREAARSVEPGMNEFEIAALIEGTFRRYGAERPAFASIVGSGPNSTTLHYRAADRFMEARDMVVMDIGASYRGYAADVTRSLPVSGRFSPEQRQVYEIVLAAQKAAEARARPGATWAELSGAAQRVVADGLARLGLIERADATYDCEGGAPCPQWRLFWMHGLGHGIGLDVHDPDPADLGAFAVGSAFTIEPGIYVRADALDYLADTPRNRALVARIRPVVERFRNVGVRIEDDYFVTANGAERVSAGAPREIAELEALMREESTWNRTRRPEVVEWYRGTGMTTP